MALIIPFPRRHQNGGAAKPKKAHPFRDAARGRIEATRLRLRHLIAVALEALDGLDHHPPDGTGEPVRKPRSRARASR